MATEEPAGTDPLDRPYPPLDAVDSRWWYWIAAYVVVSLLFVPFVIVAGIAVAAPVFVVGPDTGYLIGGPVALVLGLVAAVLVFGFALLALSVFLLLPVALYVDARHVARADLDWKPDPVLYGVLGLLQLLVTPLVGFFVAVYYLYRRHEHVGVP